MEYNLDKFLECEQNDIALFGDKTTNTAGSSAIKTGITTSFAGGQEEALVEWAIYHHIVGFDHVWLHVNEPWEDGKDLPSLDFVTFIPAFNNKVQDFMRKANSTIRVFRLHTTGVFHVAPQKHALW